MFYKKSKNFIYNFLFGGANDRSFLFDYMKKKAVTAEIGVLAGDFSQEILMKGFPDKLHLVDPWKYFDSNAYKQASYGGAVGSQEKMDQMYKKIKKRFAKEIKSKQVVLHRDLSSHVINSFKDKYFDWVYIDADHQYKFVKQDIMQILPKMKKGGYVCGDDYADGGWWKGGVKKAVDELAQLPGLKLKRVKNKQFVLLVE